MKAIVYDAGVLIAADRGKREIWAEHRVRLESGLVPLVPAPVVAQVSRGPAQAQLRRLLRGCEVVAFDEDDAHRAGALLGKAGTYDIVDAALVALAVQRQATIQTSDVTDVRRLLAAARVKLTLMDV